MDWEQRLSNREIHKEREDRSFWNGWMNENLHFTATYNRRQQIPHIFENIFPSAMFSSSRRKSYIIFHFHHPNWFGRFHCLFYNSKLKFTNNSPVNIWTSSKFSRNSCLILFNLILFDVQNGMLVEFERIRYFLFLFNEIYSLDCCTCLFIVIIDITIININQTTFYTMVSISTY